MKIQNSIIAKVGLELAKAYKETNANATYESWLIDLQWDNTTVDVMERYLKTDIKKYLGIDGYISMMEYIDTYRNELLDPHDFNITFSQWLSIKIEGLLYDDDYYFNIEEPIDINKVKALSTLND